MWRKRSRCDEDGGYFHYLARRKDGRENRVRAIEIFATIAGDFSPNFGGASTDVARDVGHHVGVPP